MNLRNILLVALFSCSSIYPMAALREVFIVALEVLVPQATKTIHAKLESNSEKARNSSKSAEDRMFASVLKPKTQEQSKVIQPAPIIQPAATKTDSPAATKTDSAVDLRKTVSDWKQWRSRAQARTQETTVSPSSSQSTVLLDIVKTAPPFLTAKPSVQAAPHIKKEHTPSDLVVRGQQFSQAVQAANHIRSQQAQDARQRQVISGSRLTSLTQQTQSVVARWADQIKLCDSRIREKEAAKYGKFLDKFNNELNPERRQQMLAQVIDTTRNLEPKIFLMDDGKGPWVKGGNAPKEGPEMKWKDNDPNKGKSERVVRVFKSSEHGDFRSNRPGVDPARMRDIVEEPHYVRYGREPGTEELLKEIQPDVWINVIWDIAMKEVVTVWKCERAQRVIKSLKDVLKDAK